MGLLSWIAWGYVSEELYEGKRKRRLGRKSESRPVPQKSSLPLPNEQELVQRIVNLPHHHRVEPMRTTKRFPGRRRTDT